MGSQMSVKGRDEVEAAGPVTGREGPCECGHSQFAHFMSREECVIRTIHWTINARGYEQLNDRDAVTELCSCRRFVERV